MACIFTCCFGNNLTCRRERDATAVQIRDAGPAPPTAAGPRAEVQTTTGVSQSLDLSPQISGPGILPFD